MFLIFLLIFSLLFTSPILASENIFGLHLTQVQDINSAYKVINSSQGDWGWATIVIRTDQLDHQTWQDFFDNCRKYHIIPIIRLSTISDPNGNWKRPENSDIDHMVAFLNTLNWPTKERHVILFNEINHGQEWGGAVDIKNYVDSAIYASQKFKNTDPNFIVMGSALDLAAPQSPPDFESAENVYKEIYAYKADYFDNIDAIASHSYPNHGFVGTPKDTGQHSIQGYQWELNFVGSLKMGKNYPIYITETGWPHREGESHKNAFYTTKTTAEFMKDSLEIWSQDKNVVAVTPFIYNYPYEPFDHFSWVDKDEKMYPEYEQILNMPKNKNKPEQITKYEVTKMFLPFIILNDTEYSGQITIKNTGQSIWGGNETNFCINPQTTANVSTGSLCTDDGLVYPNQLKIFNFKFKISKPLNVGDKTFISWENLPAFEISAFDKNATIYHPQITLMEKFEDFYRKYLNKFIFR